jgi:ABC-type dipeptide/oligopeptide/nickel transport system permease component
MPTVLGVVVLVFVMVRLVPGDPVDLMIAQAQGPVREDPKVRDAMRHQLGLDRPIYAQLVDYLSKVVRGDLGRSIFNNRSVTATIGSRLPNTLKLGFASFCITVVVGLTTGIMAAVRKGTLADLLSMLIAIVAVSMPAFWLGLMAILLFSLRLGWLPVAGASGWRHLILPAVVLGIRSTASLARITRSTMLDVLGQDYVRVARAKGLREAIVVGRHALRNAMIPIATVLGFEVGGILSGAFIIETLFAYPGIGQLSVQALSHRDFPMIQGVMLFLGLVYVLINLAVDVLYVVLDPRIRYT